MKPRHRGRGTVRLRSVALSATVSMVAGMFLVQANGTSADAVPDELVVNGTFESGTEGWRTNSAKDQLLRSTSSRHDGRGAVELSTRRLGNLVLNDSTNTVRKAAPGQQYTASAWVRTDRPRLSGQARVREVDNSRVRTHSGGFYLKDTRWHHVTFSFTTRTAGSLDLNVLAWKVRPGVRLFVDDVSLRRTPTVSTPAPAKPAPKPDPKPEPSPVVPSPGPTTPPAPEPTPPPAQVPTPIPPTPAPAPGGGGELTNGCDVSPRGIPECGVIFGAAHGSNTDPAALEKEVGGVLGVRRTYFGPTGVASAVRTAEGDLADGRVPWISFKLPHSWSDMAAGKGDAWARDLASRLSTLDGPVWVAFHHEPEGDGPIEDWVAMQRRLSPIVRSEAPNVAFTIVVTGWHQLYGESQYSLDNIWPGADLVDMVGFDIYNAYGIPRDGGTNTKPTDLATSYFPQISSWAKSKGVAWGIAETGYTDAAVKVDPDWLARSYADMDRYGGKAMAYFDTTLNSVAPWHLGDSTKKQAFAAVLRGSPKLR